MDHDGSRGFTPAYLVPVDSRLTVTTQPTLTPADFASEERLMCSVNGGRRAAHGLVKLTKSD